MKVKVNLDEVLYQKIIECLIRGEYAVGEKIMLNDLCEKFEVSRTPVVQAVKMLNKDGILKIMSNGRVYVPDFEESTVEQIIEIRRLMEGHALEKTMNGRKEHIQKTAEKLRDYAERCQEQFGRGEYVKLAMADLGFHRAIVQSAENTIMSDLYTGVQGRFIVLNYLIRPLKSRNYERTVQDHFELIGLIEKGDAKEALRRLKEHIGGAGVPAQAEGQTEQKAESYSRNQL